MIWNDGVLCCLGVALIFVHPLRAALRLHASPSLREGEDFPSPRIFPPEDFPSRGFSLPGFSLPGDFPSPGIFPPRGFSLPEDFPSPLMSKGELKGV